MSDGKNGFSEAEGITVLSLFDGMSCGQIALQKLGIKVKQYYAAEIDKHAIQVTQHNFPNTIQLGDVTKVFAKDLPKIDLLIGGSPCQGFSFAGKQLAFDDPRSKLFFEFVRLKNDCNPTYFMLENVKMKKEFEIIISKYMGVAPIEINSALLSAQNRVRLYWTNIANETYGLFGDMQCMIPQPKDKGILLRDILEIDVQDKYYLSDKAIATAIRKSDIGINPKINPDKSGTVTCGNQSAKFSIDNSTTLIVASRGRNPENPKSRESGLNTEQMLEPRYDGKTNCLTSVQKDNLVMQLNQSTESNGCQPCQQNRVYDIDGISPALMAQMSCGTHAILEQGMRIRRLTPTECERLQTVPDNEIICIFALCLDQVKNYVNAVEQNPKLLKRALSVEKTELNEFAKCVIQNTLQSSQPTKFIAQESADMPTQKQTKQCTPVNQKESDTTVNNAESIVMCKGQNQGADSALQSAFINITEGRITHYGKEELHRKGSHFTNCLNGKKPLVLFGNEIMQLVKDVDVGMKKSKDMSSTFTILSVLSINSLEQMLATYYLFAKNAITGYTQNITNQNSLSVQFQINDGYTSIVSDTQRYRMLGNGWTVDVIAYIFSFMALQKPKSEGEKIIKTA